MFLIAAQITLLCSRADLLAPHTGKIKVERQLSSSILNSTHSHEFFKAPIPNSFMLPESTKIKYKQKTEILVIYNCHSIKPENCYSSSAIY